MYSEEIFKAIDETIDALYDIPDNYQVIEALAALRCVQSEFDSTAFAAVKEGAELLILSSQEKVRETIAGQKCEPKRFAYLMIQNVAACFLSSGQYHIYRGVLNPEGHSFLRIYNTATNLLVVDGFYSYEHAEEDKACIQAAIASVG